MKLKKSRQNVISIFAIVYEQWKILADATNPNSSFLVPKEGCQNSVKHGRSFLSNWGYSVGDIIKDLVKKRGFSTEE